MILRSLLLFTLNVAAFTGLWCLRNKEMPRWTRYLLRTGLILNTAFAAFQLVFLLNSLPSST